MAFLQVIGSKRVLQGICPVDVTLAEAVSAGDLLGIDTATWVLSAHASAEQPLLVAGVGGKVGDKIQAYIAAVIECVNVVANVATVGGKVAYTDAGLYAAAGSGTPDVGFVASIGSDSLTAVIVVCPMAAQLTVVRA